MSESYLIHLDPITGAQQSIKTHNLEVDKHLFMLVNNGDEGQNVVAVPKSSSGDN